MGFSGDPVGGFAGIDDEGVVEAADVLVMGMAVDDQVIHAAVDNFIEIMLGVGHEDLYAAEFTFINDIVDFAAERADDVSEERFFPLVVSEDGDQFGIFEVGKGLGGERGDEVAGMEDIFNLKLIKDFDGGQDMFVMVVGVGDDTDLHVNSKLHQFIKLIIPRLRLGQAPNASVGEDTGFDGCHILIFDLSGFNKFSLGHFYQGPFSVVSGD